MKSARILAATVLLLQSGGCGEGPKPNNEPVVIKTDPVKPDSATCADYQPGTKVSSDYVCAHNDVRATASPAPAAPLPLLAWNEDLARVAAAWAQNCTWEHNPDRSSQYRAIHGVNVYVGENLYVSSAASVSPDDAVAAWAGEAADYHYDTNACDDGKMCGHYTQLVWADTREVGCGMAVCANVAGSSLKNATLVVCDYAPGGNIVGQKPYEPRD